MDRVTPAPDLPARPGGEGLHTLDAATLLRAYGEGRLSPVDVVAAVLAHIEACEPHLHATYALDAEAAMDAARASEARWLAGRPLRCGGHTLDGVPVTLKENIATRGVPVPLGTRASVLTPATADAPPAARLREAGAVCVCKTTMPDYGMLSSGLSSFHPLTRNPWDLSRNPGGSSAGAAAAAAAGYGPLHLGTDIGGSVRLPASWCGLFALKPSLGRIPIHPAYMARVAGPMTRRVDDAARMMAVLSQADAADPMSLPYQDMEWTALDLDLHGLRLGLWLDAGAGLALDAQVREAVVAAARLFEAAGARVEPLPAWATPHQFQGIDRFWRARSAVDLAALPPERRELVLPFIHEWAAPGAQMSGAEVFDAYTQTVAMRAATVAATKDFDFVLSPVSPVLPFPAEWPCPTNDPVRALEHIDFTVPFSMSEQPAASINGGYSREGWPIGLQIAGRRFDDLGVLRLSRAWERMRPAQRDWPVMFSGQG